MAGTPPARVGSKVNLRWLGNPSEGPSAQSSNKLEFCSDTPHQHPERARQNMNPGSFLEEEAGQAWWESRGVSFLLVGRD